MGFLGGLFGRSASSGDDAVSASGMATLTCDACGCDVNQDEMEEGQCEDCYNSEYTGPKYCCGMIYEDGEDTCMSCGDSI